MFAGCICSCATINVAGSYPYLFAFHMQPTCSVERDATIVSSMSWDTVTLLSRSFGRGTDFMCHDKKVDEKGGVHVVQTFFSIDVAEEVQIQGRTGR